MNEYKYVIIGIPKELAREVLNILLEDPDLSIENGTFQRYGTLPFEYNDSWHAEESTGIHLLVNTNNIIGWNFDDLDGMAYIIDNNIKYVYDLTRLLETGEWEESY